MKNYHLNKKKSGEVIRKETKKAGATYNDIVNELEKRGFKVSVDTFKQVAIGKQALGGMKNDDAYKKLASLFGVRTDYIKGLSPIRTERELEEMTEKGTTAFIDYLSSIGYETTIKAVSQFDAFYLPEYMPYFDFFSDRSKAEIRFFFPEDMTEEGFYKKYFNWDWVMLQHFRSIDFMPERRNFYKNGIWRTFEIEWATIPNKRILNPKKLHKRIEIDYRFYIRDENGGGYKDGYYPDTFYFIKKKIDGFARIELDEDANYFDADISNHPKKYNTFVLQDGCIDDFDYLKSIYESMIKKGGGKN